MQCTIVWIGVLLWHKKYMNYILRLSTSSQSFTMRWSAPRVSNGILTVADTWQTSYAMVTCEIKWFWNTFKTISAHYFTCNHRQVVTCEMKGWNKFISHVTMSEVISKLFQPLKELWNYFKIISATLNMSENIHKLQEASEIILQ